MANRHLSRSIVLQTLFECDVREKTLKDAEEIIVRNATEFAGEISDMHFMMNLLGIIFNKKQKIDFIIEKAAPDWPIDKISIVDRNVLRIGLAELLFANHDEVPTKVAINEAIELSKTFGGESSGKFVNGVLGAVYKEIGDSEQNKNQKSKNSTPKTLPLEKKVGAVIYTIQNDEYYIALVHDVFGHWTLSKGGVKEEEDLEEALKRVIKEELDIDVIPKEKLGENDYVANHPEKGRIRKHVIYYLAEAKFKELKLEKNGGLDDVHWFKFNEILELNFYDDILPLIIKAVKRITSNPENK